jgi:hypothetical protein
LGGPPAAAAAVTAAIANAVKAFGTIVRVEPEEFMKILSLDRNPLVVQSRGGLFSRSNKYLTSYRGLAFFCKSRTALNLPGESQ